MKLHKVFYRASGRLKYVAGTINISGLLTNDDVLAEILRNAKQQLLNRGCLDIEVADLQIDCLTVLGEVVSNWHSTESAWPPEKGKLYLIRMAVAPDKLGPVCLYTYTGAWPPNTHEWSEVPQ
jgi:hypothetical protein